MGFILANTLQKMFPNYDLTGKTWAALTRAPERSNEGAEVSTYEAPAGSGPFSRGALRYQILVPSYTVMFAYFLVLTVGWLFVAEKRQGTLKRLRAAPLSRPQILIGKLLPCLMLSIAQGVFLLVAGKVVFGMSWGPEPWWLLLVVICTSLSAMGLAMLVASLAQTEAQVAIYGTLLVLVLAGLSGCLMGDRELMPENMQRLSLITPHAWALVAYKQLLANPGVPNVSLILQSCAVLTGFGAGFLLLAWAMLRLDDAT
jgi:ABC-type multidrug transport system permease subunit